MRSQSITLPCKQCGKEFTAPTWQKRTYCSQKCAYIAGGIKARKVYPLYTCEKCGKEFRRRQGSGRFCSRACSDSVTKRPKVGWTTKQCVYCGKGFECPPYWTVTSCSITCAARYKAQTVQGKNHPLYKEKIEMYCEVCGQRCFVKPSLVRRFRVCSRNCGGVLATLAQKRVSSIEIIMQQQMIEAGLEPIPQYVIGSWVADFAFPEQHLVIECDGDYWHNLPKVQKRDQRKNTYLAKHGWHVLRLAEKDINTSPAACLQQIQDTLAKISS